MKEIIKAQKIELENQLKTTLLQKALVTEQIAQLELSATEVDKQIIYLRGGLGLIDTVAEKEKSQE